jgi:hypothetical protein
MFTLNEDAALAMEKAEQAQQKRAQEEAEAIAAQQRRAAAEAQAAAEEAKWGKNRLIICAGELAINGVQLLPAKLIGVIQEIWKMTNKPFLGSTSFTRDILTDAVSNSKLTGVYDATTKSVVISLHQLWEDCTKPECLQRMGMAEQVWATLLQVVSHEIVHAVEPEERACEVRAKDIITTLAQKFDLECPAIVDMGWFAPKLDEWYASIENSDEELHKLQRQMRMEGVPYIFASGKRLSSMRQWFRLYHVERREETAWDEAVSSLILQGAQPTPPANPHVTNAAATTIAEAAMTMGTYEMPKMPGVPAAETTAAGLNDLRAQMAALGVPFGDGCSTVTEEGYDASAQMPGELNFGETPNYQPAAQQGQQKQYSGPAPWAMPSSIPPQPLEAPIDELRTYTREVMIRAFMAIFGYCGWNGQGGYSDPDFVARTPINVTDIPHVNNILLGLDTVVDKRKVYDQPTQGIIRGFVGKAAKMPQYSLHINHGSKVVRYSLMPQNPERPGPRGQEAKAGAMFGWVTMPGEGDKSVYVAKISCPSGVVNRANMVFEKLV